MKKMLLFAVASVCFCVNSSSANAEDGLVENSDVTIKKGYIGIKGGQFNPNKDSGNGTSSSVGGLINFDSGINLEVTAGGRLNKYFAIEAGVGGYGAGLNEATRKRLSSDAKLVVIPFTVSAMAILPLSIVDVFAGAGIGLYSAKFKVATSTSNGSYNKEYKAEAFGYQTFAGVDLNINPRVAIGAEYRYINSEAEFTSSSSPSLKLQIGGTVVNGGFKFRF